MPRFERNYFICEKRTHILPIIILDLTLKYIHYIICWHFIETRKKIKKHSKTDWICHKKVAAETKQFSGPVPRKQHTLSHTSHNVRFKQTFLHFNVLAKKNFLKSMSLHKTRNILLKNFFTREIAQVCICQWFRWANSNIAINSEKSFT